MKKQAMTMAEIIIAMTLITALSVIAINTFKAGIPDSDMIKFKHTYGTIASLISQVLENRDLYPDANGFANTTSVTMRKTGKTYAGSTKFRDAFKEKINILEDNITISETSIPLYEQKVSGGTKLVTAKSVDCFKNNSGVTFCPPTTPENNSLHKIYLRVHVNENTDIQNAIYFIIHANGKIEFPTSIDGKFNCLDKSFNNYYQCAVIASLDSM